jgi:uncharacterized protein YdhG (YjbR/CyaY superfamily)
MSGRGDVDAYIFAAPALAQPKLRQLRSIILGLAPTAFERISYKMPYFEYKGRLAWFRCANGYIGLYLRPPVIAEHKKELAGYVTTKSAIHLPLEKKLPAALIRKLIRARMKKNEKGE